MVPAPIPPLVVFDLRPLQCAYAGRGIGRYTHELLRALMARLAEKPDYRLLALGFKGEEAPPGLNLLTVAPRWERVWIWDQVVLPFQLWRAKARIFHSCAAMGPLKEVNFPIPFVRRSVLTVHDWNLYAEDASPVELFYRHTRRLKTQRRFLRHAAALVTDAECIAEETRILGAVPSPKVKVILPGGDHLEAVDEIPFTGKTGFVLSIGDGPHKGLDTAYRALSLARNQGFDREWIVVGNPDRVRLLAGIGKNPPGWIRIIPSVTDAELKGMYRAAFCLLFPSRREGFGFPVLEAMRMGCPALVADVEPVNRLLGDPAGLIRADNTDGFAEALRRLSLDEPLRRARVDRGRDKARNYTWAKTAGEILSLWEFIFSRSPDLLSSGRRDFAAADGAGPSGGIGRR